VYLLRWRDEISEQTAAGKGEAPYNPLARLQAELDLAVSEERFEDAARLRDTIRQHSRAPGGAEPTL
jgi:protein-arginine kinase activator protein McsA